MKIIKHGKIINTRYKCTCQRCDCEFIAEHSEIVRRVVDNACPAHVIIAICPDCRYETGDVREI